MKLRLGMSVPVAVGGGSGRVKLVGILHSVTKGDNLLTFGLSLVCTELDEKPPAVVTFKSVIAKLANFERREFRA